VVSGVLSVLGAVSLGAVVSLGAEVSGLFIVVLLFTVGGVGLSDVVDGVVVVSGTVVVVDVEGSTTTS
jgi:hypothetical protein